MTTTRRARLKGVRVHTVRRLDRRGRFVEPAVRDAMTRAHGRRKLGVLERAIELHRMGSAGTRSCAEDAFLGQVRATSRW